METRPLVKFIRNYIMEWSGVFSMSSLVRIPMTSFLLLHSCLCKNTLVYVINPNDLPESIFVLTLKVYRTHCRVYFDHHAYKAVKQI